MTPEKARELLDNATPGPWVCVGAEEQYPRVSREGYACITNDAENYNAPLIAAAPELAENIATMYYEYLVQVERFGVWVGEERSFWGPYSMAASRLAHAKGPARTVRRLVSKPEVIES